MNTSIENKIRFKAALIYIVVAIVCVGMILFIYKFRKDVDNQKIAIFKYQYELSLTDSLVSTVNKAQSEAARFVITTKSIYFKKFKNHLLEVETITNKLISEDNSMMNISGVDYFEILKEINILLREKGQVIIKLNEQLNKDNPIDSVSEKLNAYDPIVNADSLIISTTIKDTLFYSAPQKSLWKRFSEVFSPDTKRDTVMAISTLNIDTLKIPKSDSLSIISEVSGFASKAKKDYVNQMNVIGDQVKHLLLADQEISSRITNLLVELYSQTIYSRLKEIQKSEQLVRINNNYSIGVGIIALILVLAFIILIINDVNKGYAARKALEKANALARQIMDSRHKLLLSVSHDIKTPLNSILGYLELNKSNRELLLQDIYSMQNSGKHILALLDNLLEFSSLEQGNIKAVQKGFNVKELCVEIVEMFLPLARKKDLEFNWDFEFDENLVIYADLLKIKQIMINILSNSVKYTLIGIINFRVTYRGGHLCFEVKDSGIGIPKEQLPILFIPFSRVEESSSLVEGRGLGLYVVKGLVDLLEGEIKVTSVVDKGTDISIKIPAQEVDQLKEIKKDEQLNILIIDDDPTFRTMLRDMLLKLGHKPEICATEDGFKAKLESMSDYDIILTDMEMGTFSGSDVLKIVRKVGLHLRVIAMTAHADFNEKAVVEMGFDAYLCKPVTMTSLSQLFGGKMNIYYDSGLLSEMFNDDRDAINEILKAFIQTTEENIKLLKQSVKSGDFKKSQAICHKMLPMFMQVGVQNGIPILQKMDSLRFENSQKYQEWKEDLSDFILNSEKLVIHLRQEIF